MTVPLLSVHNPDSSGSGVLWGEPRKRRRGRGRKRGRRGEEGPHICRRALEAAAASPDPHPESPPAVVNFMPAWPVHSTQCSVKQQSRCCKEVLFRCERIALCTMVASSNQLEILRQKRLRSPWEEGILPPRGLPGGQAPALPQLCNLQAPCRFQTCSPHGHTSQILQINPFLHKIDLQLGLHGTMGSVNEGRFASSF